MNQVCTQHKLNARYQHTPDHRTDIIALMYMLPPHYPTGTINRFASGISVFDIAYLEVFSMHISISLTPQLLRESKERRSLLRL